MPSLRETNLVLRARTVKVPVERGGRGTVTFKDRTKYDRARDKRSHEYHS